MPLDLGHEVCRKPQVIEGLLKGFGGVLRLAAVSREALLHFLLSLAGTLRYKWATQVSTRPTRYPETSRPVEGQR
jgi:hypothetical protein